MSVFRVNKNSDYTVMSNYHLRDKNLSYKAKGLLSFMLSLPDDWDYSINGLVAVSKEEIKAVRSGIKELEQSGYITRERFQCANGKFDYNYSVYEQPYSHFGHTLDGHAQNGLQINTKEQNTENKDKVDKQINKYVYELIKKEFISDSDLDIYKYSDLFDELFKNYMYREIMMAISYFLRRFKENKGYDENGSKIENKFAYFKTSILSNLKRITEDDVLDWQ